MISVWQVIIVIGVFHCLYWYEVQYVFLIQGDSSSYKHGVERSASSHQLAQRNPHQIPIRKRLARYGPASYGHDEIASHIAKRACVTIYRQLPSILCQCEQRRRRREKLYLHTPIWVFAAQYHFSFEHAQLILNCAKVGSPALTAPSSDDHLRKVIEFSKLALRQLRSRRQFFVW